MDRQEFIDWMREMISAQDTATHVYENHLPDALERALNNRDAARGALLAEYDRLAAELEQARVQLAGCAVAAHGHAQDCYTGDYGWSAAYQDVIELRKLYDTARAELAALRATFPPDAAGLLRRLAFPYRGRDCDCGRCADSRAADAWAERLDALAGEEE